MMKNFKQDEITAIQAAINSKDLSDTNKDILKSMIHQPKQNANNAELFVDGASDLHSKTAGIGGALFLNGTEIASFAVPLFDKTNNEAEYMSMIKGIQSSLELNIMNLNIFSDSELVVKQINGEYKIKNDRMMKLHSSVYDNLHQLDSWTVTHVRREKNTRADALSKVGLKIARESK